MRDSIQIAIETLRQGGTLLYPTDTIWGIGCDATNAVAIEKIYEIKQRDHSKSMLILCADEEMLRSYALNPTTESVALALDSPKPTTVIFKAQNLPENLLAGDGTIGIRIPRMEFCQNLLKQYGRPIVSTSANFSGEASPKCYNDISERLKNRIDHCVADRNEYNTCTQSSRIVKLEDNGTLIVIRD